MKASIGSYAVQMGQLQVAAVVAVNALGDIYDAETGQKIAGMLDRERTGFADSERALLNVDRVVENKFTGNTTLAVVMTNAWFDKAKLCKIAGMAHDGYARSIRPVHTSADGDSIYAVSLGRVEADLDVVGALSANVISKAIVRAVLGAEQAYGYPSAAKLMNRRS